MKMTRKQALEHIRVGVAKAGEVDKHTMRIYIENRISYQAFIEAVNKGKKLYKRRKES